MGTTNQTTGNNSSTLQFNPGSQSLYDTLTNNAGNQLRGYINSPFSNPMFMMGQGQSAKAAQNIGGTNMSALTQMMKGSGLTGQAGAGWLASQKAQTGRANQSMLGNSQTQNVLAALQRQMGAVGTGLSYSPQLTGQSGNFSQTQQTGGLGTWLPQLMGAGLSAGMAGMTGGASAMGTFGGGSVGGVSNPGLGAPSYMPGGGGMSNAFPGFGMPGSIPGMAPPNPMAFSGMYGGQ